jgi:hypothetical protein
LFLIYMNDIANVLGNSTVKLFADDTNIFISEGNLSETNAVANYKLELTNNGLVLIIHLSLNIDKTC